jgi:2-polyprenyl-3-methyl-5-hydroxy-6-metoxy-1,4-benzoquinol methylase
MDDINQEIINAKIRLNEIERIKAELDEEYGYLQDKIHLYFDSEIHDTDEAEKFIIGDFWSKAYSKYRDGGYITNDEYISRVRFDYERKLLKKIIEEYVEDRVIALDIGCGEGRYTHFLSSIFDTVLGIDLSEERILKNKAENKNTKVAFSNENFLTMPKDKIGVFDFVFASDVFTYTPDKEIRPIFDKLLQLLSKSGVLIMRESTLNHGSSAWRSKGYVAYYRNAMFYEQGGFERTFINSWQVYAYSLYYMNKYFNVFKDKRALVESDPMLLDEIVPEYIDPLLKSAHYYLHRVD